MAPTQLGKFHHFPKPFSISCHFSRVGGAISVGDKASQIASHTSGIIWLTVDVAILNLAPNPPLLSPEAKKLQNMKENLFISYECVGTPLQVPSTLIT